MPSEDKKQAAFQATAGMWRVVYIRPPRQSILVKYPGLRWPEGATGAAAWLPRLFWGTRKVEIPGSSLDGESLVELVANELNKAENEGFELHGDMTFSETYATPQRRSFFRVQGPTQGIQTGGLMLVLRKKSTG